MIVSLVAALDEGQAIGIDGDLPWSLPDDQKYFRRITRGHCLVMGRKTFDSIGRPLPGRTNIVLTRNPDIHPEGTVLARDLDGALAEAASRNETEVFIAGGAAVYAEALPRADRMYLTRVHVRFEGDTFFPTWDPADWRLLRHEDHAADDRHAHAFTFEEYQRAR